MVDIKRSVLYSQVWIGFRSTYTVDQIRETIELIEKTKIYPNVGEESYKIWQKYLEFKATL